MINLTDPETSSLPTASSATSPSSRSWTKITGQLCGRQRVPPPRPVDSINDLDKPLYRAAHRTRAATGLFFDDKTLACAGICADTVKRVGPEPRRRTSLENWRAIARSLDHRDGNMHSAEEAHEQFMSMLMGEAGGGWNGDFEGNDVRVTVRPDSHVDDMYSPEEKAMLMIPHRRLIITKRGFIAAVARVGVGVGVFITT